MTGPMKGPDGKEIPPTGKRFEVDFCTVARWDNGQIVEENLFYDLVTFMKQIGLSGYSGPANLHLIGWGLRGSRSTPFASTRSSRSARSMREPLVDPSWTLKQRFAVSTGKKNST